MRSVTGKVLKVPSLSADPGRYEYLNLENTEPDLGVPVDNDYILTSSLTGYRTWVKAVSSFNTLDDTTTNGNITDNSIQVNSLTATNLVYSNVVNSNSANIDSQFSDEIIVNNDLKAGSLYSHFIETSAGLIFSGASFIYTKLLTVSGYTTQENVGMAAFEIDVFENVLQVGNTKYESSKYYVAIPHYDGGSISIRNPIVNGIYGKTTYDQDIGSPKPFIQYIPISPSTIEIWLVHKFGFGNTVFPHSVRIINSKGVGDFLSINYEETLNWQETNPGLQIPDPGDLNFNSFEEIEYLKSKDLKVTNSTETQDLSVNGNIYNTEFENLQKSVKAIKDVVIVGADVKYYEQNATDLADFISSYWSPALGIQIGDIVVIENEPQAYALYRNDGSSVDDYTRINLNKNAVIFERNRNNYDVIDTFRLIDSYSAKYILQVKDINTNAIYFSEFSIVSDGNVAKVTEYGINYSSTDFITYDAFVDSITQTVSLCAKDSFGNSMNNYVFNGSRINLFF